jgi:hypothetical protein
LCGYGTPEVETLRFFALEGAKKHQLFLRFHALGYDPQPEASAHGDYCADDSGLVRSRSVLMEERLVDLERIDRKLLKV